MRRRPSDLDRIRNAVRLFRNEKAIELRVNLDENLPLGLKIHSGERDSLLRRLMRRSNGTVIQHARTCVFDISQRKEARLLLEQLHAKLSQIARKPISQRQVERLLAITPNERLRWSKDGRLRRSGTAQILRGARIMLYTYPPGEIERLLFCPELIAAWRQEDRHIL